MARINSKPVARRKKRHRVACVLTDSDYREVLRRCEREGVTISGLLRRALGKYPLAHTIFRPAPLQELVLRAAHRTANGTITSREREALKALQAAIAMVQSTQADVGAVEHLIRETRFPARDRAAAVKEP
jgi:hypothetical protein